jgi:hypothetical protein
MMKLGIALIVVAVIALPLPFVAALFGFLGLYSAAYWVYLASPILLILGILLVVLGARRGPQRPA